MTGWMHGVRVMVLSATFNNIAFFYRGSQFYRWMKLEKTPHLSQIFDKLYHIMMETLY